MSANRRNKAKVWLSASDIAKLELIGMARTKRGVNQFLASLGDSAVRRPSGKSGGGWVYHYTMLPPVALAAYLDYATVSYARGDSQAKD